MFRQLSCFLLVCGYFLSSCSIDSDKIFNTKGPSSQKSDFGGLLFTTVTSDYAAGYLYNYDFESGEVTKILSGQSGDPFVKVIGGKAYFFNRRPQNSNYRIFDTDSLHSSEAVLPEQTALPALTTGAPQDMVFLPNGKWLLLANDVNFSSLKIFDPSTGLSEEVSADWDIQGFRFSPSSFFEYHDKDGGHKIFVSHQGQTSEKEVENTSQQIFELEYLASEGTVRVNDLDLDKPATQGIPLTFPNAKSFLYKESGEPLIISTCYWRAGCQSGIERFDPESKSVKVVFRFKNRFLSTDFIEGESDQKLIGAVYYDEKNYRNHVIERFDISNRTFLPIHRYLDENSAGGIFHDASTKTLYIGDMDLKEKKGTLEVYQDEQKITTIEGIEGKPYNGSFYLRPN